ncbi:MAG: peptidase M23 [Thioalkalivibrio sp.]|nr:MAG: peptidase M23 [Thioalkalivibrio sp.]
MPVPRILFSLLVFGSLGVAAITVSSLLPARPAPAAESPASAPATLAGAAHDQLLHFRDCFQKAPLCADLKPFEAAPSDLQQGELEVDGQALLKDPGPDRMPPATVVDLGPGLDGDVGIRPDAEWSRHTLREGEHLGALWNSRWGLRMHTLFQLAGDPENARLLDVVHPGQEIEWQADAAGELKRLRLWTDQAQGYEWVRLDGTDQFTRVEIAAEREVSHRVLAGKVRGTVTDSLREKPALSAASARAIGLLIKDHLPPGDEIREGDQYNLLVEIETVAGDDTPYDIRLLAFALTAANGTLTAARHADGRFYTPEGEPLLPPFERHPFKGEHRITSGFNSGRRHPVTGRVAPHNGTDFAMPVGTPILAPADGRVTDVERHPLAGRFLVIQHGQDLSTRYLHLQKALVRPGQQVTRGQRIALSGNSGRTTSAHLHYELHVDGQPVDPMRAELPEGEPLAGAELARFQSTAQHLLAELGEVAASGQLAMQPLPDTGR